MGDKLDNIYHYLKLSKLIATSGQPTEAQFSAIKEAGYQVVVNLALPISVNAIPEEGAIIENLGMKYIHIPVVWENPTLENFQDFTNAMETNGDRSVFVHCAANMRVSAFMYLYNRIFQHFSAEEAEKNLHQIWTPNQIWQEFIESTIRHYQGSHKPGEPGD